MVKVIASSLRKGNVVEMDGKLHTIITAENRPPVPGTSPSIASKNGRVRATG